ENRAGSMASPPGHRGWNRKGRSTGGARPRSRLLDFAAGAPFPCRMAEAPQRLFLLDGMALVYRAHFALIRSPIYTSATVNTSALIGFATTLLDLLEKHSPTPLAVAFDTSAPTERHQLYPVYKGNRDEMPEDLAL